MGENSLHFVRAESVVMSLSLSLSLFLFLPREVKSPIISIPEANFLDLSGSARRNLVNPRRDQRRNFGIFVAGTNVNDLDLRYVYTSLILHEKWGLINIDSGFYSRSC